jgi:hypothetical protein
MGEEAVWTPEPVRTLWKRKKKYLATAGSLNSGRPVFSPSLYQLSYLGSLDLIVMQNKLGGIPSVPTASIYQLQSKRIRNRTARGLSRGVVTVDSGLSHWEPIRGDFLGFSAERLGVCLERPGRSGEIGCCPEEDGMKHDSVTRKSVRM